MKEHEVYEGNSRKARLILPAPTLTSGLIYEVHADLVFGPVDFA